MSIASADFLAILQERAEQAAIAEAAFRREAAHRIAGLARDRSFAYRKLNLLRAVAAGVVVAETIDDAAERGCDVLRDALGWSGDSVAERAVLEQFAPVGRAAFASGETKPAANEDIEAATVLAALVAFENWYAATHPAPFWALFDQYVTETPVVDF
jgi:hypothetical protein